MINQHQSLRLTGPNQGLATEVIHKYGASINETLNAALTIGLYHLFAQGTLRSRAAMVTQQRSRLAHAGNALRARWTK